MIGPRELLIFTAIVTVIIVLVTAVGYYFFTRWAQQERATGRQHIESHLAEVMREGKDGEARPRT